MSTYSELLRDPRWQKLRLKKLEESEWACQSCYDTETTLAVHHKRYVKGRKPWEYDSFELVVLCEPCHSYEHECKRLHSDLISVLPPDGPGNESEMFTMMAGYLSVWDGTKPVSETVEKFFQNCPFSFELGRLMAAIAQNVRTHDELCQLSEGLMSGKGSVTIERRKMEQIDPESL